MKGKTIFYTSKEFGDIKQFIIQLWPKHLDPLQGVPREPFPWTMSSLAQNSFLAYPVDRKLHVTQFFYI